jgi:hypothetical protein
VSHNTMAILAFEEEAGLTEVGIRPCVLPAMLQTYRLLPVRHCAGPLLFLHFFQPPFYLGHFMLSIR